MWAAVLVVGVLVVAAFLLFKFTKLGTVVSTEVKSVESTVKADVRSTVATVKSDVSKAESAVVSKVEATVKKL